MTSFHHIFKQDYDKRICLGDQNAFCYSKKKMRQLYPNKNYTVVGEVKSGKKLKSPPPQGDGSIGTLYINEKELAVFPLGKHKRLIHRGEGFLCVGENRFVAAHSNLVPFLLVLLWLLAMIAVVLILVFKLLGTPEKPVVINPDHPLPEIDPDIETLPDDGDDQVNSEEGGGFVSMVYTKDATISLSSNKATVYYQNPHKSNHGVVLELYLVSEGQEYFLGRTGLIPAGSAIYEMDVSERAVQIRAGVYTGLYRTFYYDPLTGERAAISSDITEVTVSVTD